MQEKEIACNSPIEWAKQIMQAAREGWDIDEENVQRCPQFTGNMFFAVLVKQDTNTPEIAPEVLADALERELQPKRVPPRRKTSGEK